MLRVTPIYGSTGHHPSSSSIALPPCCTLIEWGNCRVLINVGHDESMSMSTSVSTGDASAPSTRSISNPLANLPRVDAILLTDSSLQALGGLPLYVRNSATNTQSTRIKEDTATTDNCNDLSNTPIYATFPTVKMGQMNLYDHHANLSLDGAYPGYSLEDVDALFSPNLNVDGSGDGGANNGDGINKEGSGSTSASVINTDITTNHSHNGIKTLKFAQTIILHDPNTNAPAIAITPHKAGHLIGASYYTLKRLTDETEVVVAPMYHHAKEKHLDSSTLYKFGMACDVFITTCGGPGGILKELYIPNSHLNEQYGQVVPVSHNNKAILNSPSVGRDEGELVEMILSTLRRGGNVLLPVDSSGRVLELLYLLNQHWERHRLASAYNLCWVGSMVHNTLEFVRSQLEWMSAPLGNQFDAGHGHPYSLKSVQLFHNVNELDAVTHCVSGVDEEDNPGLGGAGMGKENNPTCVLATGASLDHGPARDLFLKWSENADNAIILTDSRRCVERGDIIKAKVLDATSKSAGNISGVVPSSSSSPIKMTLDDASATASDTEKGNDTPNIIEDDATAASATRVQVQDESNMNLIGSAIPTTSQISSSSTSAQLLQKWCEAKFRGEEMADVIDVDVMVPKRSPLQGMELKLFLEKEEAQRARERQEEERRAMLREVELAKGRLRLNNNANEDGGGGAQDGTATTTTSGGARTGSGSNAAGSTSTATTSSSSRPKKRSRFDADLFLKYSKPCHSKSNSNA